MISHIVLFTPRNDLPADRLRLFAQYVLAACSSIPSVTRAVIGKSIAIDPGYERSMGDTTYLFAAVLEFTDQAGLIAYLQHPSHDELGRQFWEVCQSTTVIEVDGRAPNEWTVDELV